MSAPAWKRTLANAANCRVFSWDHLRGAVGCALGGAAVAAEVKVLAPGQAWIPLGAPITVRKWLLLFSAGTVTILLQQLREGRVLAHSETPCDVPTNQG